MIPIVELLTEFFGFVGQIAENKGAKIPLTEDEIRQRSKNRAERLQDKGYAKKWIAIVKFYSDSLRPAKSLHAKNQLMDLIKSDADILSIDIQVREGKRWLVIMYMRDDYKREYLIEAK